MLALLLTTIALVIIFVITNRVLKKHIYKNKINLAMGAPICLLVFVSVFFLVSYFAKEGADTLDKMRTPSYAVGMLSGIEPSLVDLMDFASENDIDMDEMLGGEEELTPAMSLMLDNVHQSFSVSVWLLMLTVVSFAACLYGVMKMNKYIVWGSLATMSVGLIVVARSAGASIFHLTSYLLSGNFHYTGDTSDSILIPLLTVITGITAIWCCIHGFRKSVALVGYGSDNQKVFINNEARPINMQFQTSKTSSIKDIKVKA